MSNENTPQTESHRPAVGGPVERMVSGLAPKRVQLSRAAGWRMPPNTVKVDRSTRWGNPYKLHGDGYPMTAEMAVGCFASLLNADDGGWVTRDTLTTVLDVRRELRGKNLACWCKLDQPCHADVLLRVANHEPANVADQRTP